MRKTDKYQDLHKEMSSCGFNVTIKTIEVGSRGVLDSSSFSIFKDICSVSNKSITELQQAVCRKVICCSFVIWSKRNSKDWS